MPETAMAVLSHVTAVRDMAGRRATKLSGSPNMPGLPAQRSRSRVAIALRSTIDKTIEAITSRQNRQIALARFSSSSLRPCGSPSVPVRPSAAL